VTVIQRFGSALNLNVHFHTLMIDGVYEIAPNGAAVFHPVPEPTDEEVTAVAERVYREVVRKLEAQGDEGGAALAGAEPILAALAGASVAGVAASGPRRGARTLRRRSNPSRASSPSSRGSASTTRCKTEPSAERSAPSTRAVRAGCSLRAR
jgi:hypothetical protein